MNVSEVQLYKTLKGKLGDQEAQEVVSFIKCEINSETMAQNQNFLTKNDKIELMQCMKNDKIELMQLIKDQRIELMRTIYIVGLLQFLAIVSTVLVIQKFALGH